MGTSIPVVAADAGAYPGAWVHPAERLQCSVHFHVGDLAMCFRDEEVTLAGKHVKLTPVEYRLLYQLVRNADHLVSQPARLDHVWGVNYEASPEYLKLFVSRLRAKLRRRGVPEYIESERGRGHRVIGPRHWVDK